MIAIAQPSTVMTWNALNFSSSSTDRVPYFQTVIDSIQPDVLVVQELIGLNGAEYFHTAVLGNAMGMASFIDGYGTDNALYYDTTVYRAIETIPIQTALRDISQFVLLHLNSGDTLRLFSVHFKSSQGSANENQRLREVDSLRKVTDALPPDAYSMVLGDFNFYSSAEAGYQRLIQANGATGYFVDPLPMTGIWNNPNYAPFHTQSSRLRGFGGGASSGLDDRFDLILFSPNFNAADDIQYMANSTWAVGNDGQHYNDSINAEPNSSVSQSTAHALHYASDHLPVIAEIEFHNTLGVDMADMKPILNVYPNPSHGIFTVQLPPTVNSILSVKDAFGRVVLTDTSKGMYTVDVSDLPSGVYFLQVVNSFGQNCSTLLSH